MTSDVNGTVVGLQGYSVSPAAPTDGYVLTWDATDGYWKAAPVPASTGSYGQMSFTTSTTNLNTDTYNVTVGTGFNVITPWSHSTLSNNTTPSVANSNITLNKAGVYYVSISISTTLAPPGYTLVFAVFVNGSQNTDLTSSVPTIGSDVTNCEVTLTGLYNASINDVLDVRCMYYQQGYDGAPGGGVNASLYDGNFTVFAV